MPIRRQPSELATHLEQVVYIMGKEIKRLAELQTSNKGLDAEQTSQLVSMGKFLADNQDEYAQAVSHIKSFETNSLTTEEILKRLETRAARKASE